MSWPLNPSPNRNRAHNPRAARWWQRWGAGLGLVAVAGCSGLQLGYNQLPRLTAWWVGSYVDLSTEQDTQLRDGLRAWQAWHRREELPRWRAVLAQADAALDEGVTEAELQHLEREAQAAWRRSLQQLAPVAGAWLARWSPAQWQHLERRLLEKRQEWLDTQHDRSPAERQEARVDAWLQGLERGLGRLGRAQRAEARRLAAAWPLPNVPEAKASALSARQRRVVDALRAWSRGEAAAGTEALLGVLAEPQDPQEAAQRQAVRAALLAVLNSADAAQRQAMRAHWKDWDGDLAVLLRERP